MEPDNNKKLDSLIENAIGKETSFDFDKWKQQHPDEISAYEDQTSSPTQGRHYSMFFKQAVAAAAIAAMITIAIILLPVDTDDTITHNPPQQNIAKEYKPLPPHIATMGRLKLAYQRGGLDAIDKFVKRTVAKNNSQQNRLSAQQILNELEFENKTEKGNHDENQSYNSTAGGNTAA